MISIQLNEGQRINNSSNRNNMYHIYRVKGNEREDVVR